MAIRKSIVIKAGEINLDHIKAVHREQITFGLIYRLADAHFNVQSRKLDFVRDPVEQYVWAYRAIQERNLKMAGHDRQCLGIDHDIATASTAGRETRTDSATLS